MHQVDWQKTKNARNVTQSREATKDEQQQEVVTTPRLERQKQAVFSEPEAKESAVILGC